MGKIIKKHIQASENKIMHYIILPHFLKKSISWRITFPLRNLGVFFDKVLLFF